MKNLKKDQIRKKVSELLFIANRTDCRSQALKIKKQLLILDPSIKKVSYQGGYSIILSIN